MQYRKLIITILNEGGKDKEVTSEEQMKKIFMQGKPKLPIFNQHLIVAY